MLRYTSLTSTMELSSRTALPDDMFVAVAGAGATPSTGLWVRCTGKAELGRDSEAETVRQGQTVSDRSHETENQRAKSESVK